MVVGQKAYVGHSDALVKRDIGLHSQLTSTVTLSNLLMNGEASSRRTAFPSQPDDGKIGRCLDIRADSTLPTRRWSSEGARQHDSVGVIVNVQRLQPRAT